MPETVPETIATDFEVLDERFRRYGGDTRTERIFTGGRWL